MTRRGSGEGSIYQRTDGRWCAYLTLATGKRRYLYGATRQDVGRLLRTALKQRDDGLPLPAGRETVGTYLTAWIEGQKTRLRPRTWQRYEQYVRTHTLPTLGRVPLTNLSPQHLERLYDDRLAAGLGAASVHHLHATLHRALEQALRWNLVVRNVADLVDPPRVPRREMTVLDAEQVRVLLDAAAGGPLEAILTVAVTTGMRKGELLALRWRNVDLSAGVITVVGTLTRQVDGTLTVAETKTARSRRRVELAPMAVEALRKQRREHLERRQQLGAEWNELEFVFPSALGRAQDGSNLLYGQFHPLLRSAGLPIIRFHDLRHTAATLLLGQGIHPKIASEMLGHSTIAITLDLYSHVTPTMQRQAADAMNDLLAPATVRPLPAGIRHVTSQRGHRRVTAAGRAPAGRPRPSR